MSSERPKETRRRIDPLAAPLRRRILRRLLRDGDGRSTDHVAGEFDLEPPRAAYHLRVLAENGLVRMSGRPSDGHGATYEPTVAEDDEILGRLARTEAEDEGPEA